MKVNENPTISSLSDKKKNFLKFVCSPGTAGSFLDAPMMVCPTGEKCLVMREMRMKQITVQPDVGNRIVFLTTPFFEAPFIRIFTDANGAFTSWQSYQLPGYSGVDPLKENQIYAWRMIANSLTGVCDAAPIDATGSVTVASLPLSLDVKHVYATNTSNSVNPVSFPRCLDYIPITADEVSSITNQFTTHKAVDGSYCVLKHTDPNLPFTYRDRDEHKATFSIYKYKADGSLEVSEETRGNNFLEFANATNLGASCSMESVNQALAVTYPSCMNLGLTVFSGLKPAVNFTFKSVVAWEFVPKMNSSKIAQCRPMEPKDPFFLHVLNVAELKTPSFGRASDNSFGTFIKSMLNAITNVTPFVKEIAAVLPLPPQFKLVIDKVAEIIPKINNAVKRVDMKTTKQGAAPISVKSIKTLVPKTKSKTSEVVIVEKGAVKRPK